MPEFEQGRLVDWAAQGLQELKVEWAASPLQSVHEVGPTTL